MFSSQQAIDIVKRDVGLKKSAAEAAATLCEAAYAAGSTDNISAIVVIFH